MSKNSILKYKRRLVSCFFLCDKVKSSSNASNVCLFVRFSHESGVDNPFRPDGELSREADTIVSLIKEGKPITPVKGEEPELDTMVANGFHHDQTDSQEVANSTSPPKPKSGANGSTPKDQKMSPGVVEVQHSVIVPPSDGPAVEQVVIKKKPKCKCCIIQ